MSVQTERILVLPVSPDVENLQDLKRYVRELHKVLDEWNKKTHQDTHFFDVNIQQTQNEITTLQQNIQNLQNEFQIIQQEIQTIQNIINQILIDIDELKTYKHSHENKDILDDIEIALKHNITWGELL